MGKGKRKNEPAEGAKQEVRLIVGRVVLYVDHLKERT